MGTYSYRCTHSSVKSGHKYFEFMAGDRVLVVEIGHFQYSPSTERWCSPSGRKILKANETFSTISFASKDPSGKLGFELTQGGNAFKVVSTIIEIIGNEAARLAPTYLVFDADLLDAGTSSGKVGAYCALIQRHASRLGYRPEAQVSNKLKDTYIVEFILKKKEFTDESKKT